jgi:hypothetical protein
MSYQDIVTLYFERSNEMQTFWTFYLAVCVLMPALVGIMRPSRRRLVVGAILSFAFAVTAAVNLNAVMDISNARLACRDLLLSGSLPGAPAPAVQKQIRRVILPPAVGSVVAVHIAGDLFTLGILWYLALSRRTPMLSSVDPY